ncbi:hypothetical protein OHC50_04355 [Paenarthrobacter ilicis]|uniref:DUF4357 domain-containing protein n=1 Tax=Paenarthrobacter ilicis TaxID=43665 RepID=UPI00300918AE
MNESSPAKGTTYYFRHRSCEMEGRLVGEQMLVAARSSARAAARPGAPETILSRRDRLISDGVAEVLGDRFVLKQDHIFTGPGLAVDLMNGGHVREPLKLWRDADGTSLHDIRTNE